MIHSSRDQIRPLIVLKFDFSLIESRLALLNCLYECNVVTFK